MFTIKDVLNNKHGESKRREVYWLSDVPDACQLSGRKIITEFVDGRVPGMSSWAIMAPDYFRGIGGTLGTGRGQHYRKQANGRWLKIEG